MIVFVVGRTELVNADVPGVAGSALVRGYLDKQLPLHVRIQYPSALLIVKRVPNCRIEVVRGQVARMGCESFLTAHRIRSEFVGSGENEPLLVPRVLCDVVEEFDGCPAAH